MNEIKQIKREIEYWEKELLRASSTWEIRAYKRKLKDLQKRLKQEMAKNVK